MKLKRSFRVHLVSLICTSVCMVYVGFLYWFLDSKADEGALVSEYLFEGVQFFGVILAITVVFLNHFEKVSRDSLADFQRFIDKAVHQLDIFYADSAQSDVTKEQEIELLATYLSSAVRAFQSISIKRHVRIVESEIHSVINKISCHCIKDDLSRVLGDAYRCKDQQLEGSFAESCSLIMKFINPERFQYGRPSFYSSLCRDDLQHFHYSSLAE